MNNMSILPLFGIAIAALILTYTLGFSLLRAITSLDELESLVLSGLSGITAQAGIAGLIFFTGMFEWWLYIGLWMTLLVGSSILAHRRQRLLPQQTLPKSWLISGLILWTALVLTESLLPIYTGSGWYGDWWMHYDIALFYLGQRPPDTVYFELYTVVSRTPLFNLAEAFFMAIFGQEFFVYQLTAITTSFVFLPIFLLLVNHHRVALGVLIIGLNPFIIRNILYPWPKLLTAGYILASLYFFLKWRHNEAQQTNLLAWGGLTGLAILTHPSALFYALALGLDILRTHRWSGIKLIPAIPARREGGIRQVERFRYRKE